jgi:hypothetical protein
VLRSGFSSTDDLNKETKQGEIIMKKLMIALAIVALASVAQAELLATWTMAAGGSASATENGTVNMDQVTFGDLTRTGLNIASTTAGTFASNGFGDAGPISLVPGDPQSGYQITGASINSTSINGSNTAPGHGAVAAERLRRGASLTRTSSAVNAWDASIRHHRLRRQHAGDRPGRHGERHGRRHTHGRQLPHPEPDDERRLGPPFPEPATMGLLGLGRLGDGSASQDEQVIRISG